MAHVLFAGPIFSDRAKGANGQPDAIPQRAPGPAPMIARIYRPAKTAMQSGQARTKAWVLEFEGAAPREVDPLMGWTSSTDMRAQVRLEFETKEEAVAYAERNGIPFRLSEPKVRRAIHKSYADNFKFGRREPWTH